MVYKILSNFIRDSIEDVKYYLLWSVPGKSRSISMTMFNAVDAITADVVGKVIETIESMPDKKPQQMFKHNDALIILFDNGEEYVLFDYTKAVVECGSDS